MEGKQLQVDVILPYYRGDLWIEEAIESVLAQTYPDWHLTVVDDASPDDSLSRIRRRYQDRTDRISFIYLDQRHGAAGARMEAIRRTAGGMIAFIDQDDRWRAQKLERQITRFGREPTVQAVHTDIQHIDSKGNVIRGSADRENSYRATIEYEALQRAALMRRLFYMNSIRLVSATISRSAFEEVGGFDESFFGSEDWEFWVRFAGAGYRIAHLAEPLVQRRLHERNVSRSHSQERLLELLQAAEEVPLTYPSLVDLIPYRKSLLLRQIITDCLLHNQGSRARSQINQLIELNRGGRRLLGYVFRFLSFLGPLQAPVAKMALGLVRKVTPQGGSASRHLL